MLSIGEVYILVFASLGAFASLFNSHQAWFKPEKFIEKDRAYKDNAPEWKKWFARSTSVIFDLWFYRIGNAFGFTFCVILIAKVLISRFL